MQDSSKKTGLFESCLLFSALLAFGIVVLGDSLSWHQGYGEVDEAAVVRYAWEWASTGKSIGFSFGSGTLKIGSVALGMQWLGSHPLALPLPALIIFYAECVLLWLLAFRLFNAQIAWGSVIFNLLCAFSFSRARSLLSYTFVPCELLILLHLMLNGKQFHLILAGLFAGLMAFDYEGWAYGAWPVLLGALIWLKRRKKLPGLAPSLAAWGLGALFVLALSWPQLESYFYARLNFTFHAPAGERHPWGQSLVGLVWGSEVLPGLGGARSHPTLPPWSWPLLLLGGMAAWKKHKYLLAWIALGGLMLIPPSSGLNEANRGIAAWPAFCILAGLGLASLSLPRAALAAWLFLGGAWELHAFLKSQDHYGPSHYAPSQARRQAADWIVAESRSEPLRLLSSLGYRRMSDFEWMCSGATLDPDTKRAVALISWEALAALPHEKIMTFKSPGGLAECYLYELRGPWVARLNHAETILKPIWDSQDRMNVRHSLLLLAQAMRSPAANNPWVRTSLWERRMTLATVYNLLDPGMLAQLKQEPLLHAGPLYHSSGYLRRYAPDLAAELHAQALRLDPRLLDYERKLQNQSVGEK